MTELLITYAQFLGASALLVAFYWLVLRHRASYKLSRLYLIGVPMLSAMMYGLKFEIEVPAIPFLAETEAVASKITPALIINEPQYNSVTETVSATEPTSAIEIPMKKEPQTEKSQVNIDYAAIIRIIVPLISVILLLIAAFHIIKLLCIKQKLSVETTAEGYELIHSSAVQTPFSFGKTIFLPEGLDADRESYIVCHEKAHITHGHYIDVWIAEILARIFWFNPFVWYCRSELSNIHEFEADHDVIVSGADILAYQTTLLEMVMNESSPVVSGFNHSFIRQRFIEMKKTTVNTLGRMGKFGTAAWVVALICLFTISFKPIKANTVPVLKDPQLFTIIGHVDENITDSCYNIYLSDEYFHIDGDKPVACVPVVDKQFRYEIPLTKSLAGRLRCIFPGGELCESWIDLFFVPGTTVDLTVHNGNYTLLYPDDNYENYDNRLRRAIYATRKATNWESPHIEKIDGQRWAKPEQNCQNGYMGLHVQEVIFNDRETVLRLVTDFNTGNLSFSSRSYLTDEQGNQYKLLRAISDSELDENCSKQVHVYGGLYAFEPLPKGIKTFSFFNGPDGVRNVTHITEAKPTDETPNFKLNITATPGIGDSGYLINCRNKWGSYEQLDDIALNVNRQCSFSMHLDSLLEGVVQATFPDGSVCRYVMSFPFIPGETAELTVKNGVFSLTGTNFYKRWYDADELFENAKRFHTPEETRKIVIDYIKEHSSDEACFRYFQKEYLSCQELVALASESLLATDYGQQLKRVAAHEAKLQSEANEPLVILFKKTNEDMYSADIIDIEEYEAYLANPIPGYAIFRYEPGDPDIPFYIADHPRVINNGLIQIQPKDWPRAERFKPQEPTTKNGQCSTEPQQVGWSKATIAPTTQKYVTLVESSEADEYLPALCEKSGSSITHTLLSDEELLRLYNEKGSLHLHFASNMPMQPITKFKNHLKDLGILVLAYHGPEESPITENSEIIESHKASDRAKTYVADIKAGRIQPAPNDCFMLEDVDVAPKFLECDFMQYISKNLRYPIAAAQKGIEGYVVVGFTILKDGTVAHAKRMGGDTEDTELIEEAIRVVSSMPKWEPGKMQGKVVLTQMYVPVFFKLK